VTLRLETVEPMGNEIILHGRAGRNDITARIAPRPVPEPGTMVPLTLDLGKLHFFDPDREQAIAGDAM
jgi:multiple sugar transport system ATP-binding protein